MTDQEFIKYLGVKLLNSGEDCCSYCIYGGRTLEVCDNLQNNDRPDDNVCLEGLRKYAEEETYK